MAYGACVVAMGIGRCRRVAGGEPRRYFIGRAVPKLLCGPTLMVPMDRAGELGASHRPRSWTEARAAERISAV